MRSFRDKFGELIDGRLVSKQFAVSFVGVSPDGRLTVAPPVGESVVVWSACRWLLSQFICGGLVSQARLINHYVAAS